MTVAVTGAAGAIGYSLLFKIASGEMLGPDQPVVLSLLDLPTSMDKVQGVSPPPRHRRVALRRHAATPLPRHPVGTSVTGVTGVTSVTACVWWAVCAAAFVHATRLPVSPRPAPPRRAGPRRAFPHLTSPPCLACLTSLYLY